MAFDLLSNINIRSEITLIYYVGHILFYQQHDYSIGYLWYFNVQVENGKLWRKNITGNMAVSFVKTQWPWRHKNKKEMVSTVVCLQSVGQIEEESLGRCKKEG